eukprot:gene14071-16636_t
MSSLVQSGVLPFRAHTSDTRPPAYAEDPALVKGPAGGTAHLDLIDARVRGAAEPGLGRSKLTTTAALEHAAASVASKEERANVAGTSGEKESNRGRGAELETEEAASTWRCVEQAGGRNPTLWGVPLPALAGHTVQAKQGEGTFGMVFRAVRHGVGREGLEVGGAGAEGGRVGPEVVALKYLSWVLSTRQVVQEVQALERMRGAPHVVELLYVANQRCAGAGVVLAFPYVQGDDIQDLLVRAELGDVRRYMRCLLTALMHTHDRGLVHRDVKPSNFIFSRARGTGCLIDFGLAEDAPAVCRRGGACARSSVTPPARAGDAQADPPQAEDAVGPAGDRGSALPGGAPPSGTEAQARGLSGARKRPAPATLAEPMQTSRARVGRSRGGALVAASHEGISRSELAKGGRQRTSPCRPFEAGAGKSGAKSGRAPSVQGAAEACLAGQPAAAGRRKRSAHEATREERGGEGGAAASRGMNAAVVAVGDAAGVEGPRRGTSKLRPTVIGEDLRRPAQRKLKVKAGLRKSGAVDVWSSGVILASLLTGRYPLFDGGADDTAALTEIAVLC